MFTQFFLEDVRREQRLKGGLLLVSIDLLLFESFFPDTDRPCPMS